MKRCQNIKLSGHTSASSAAHQCAAAYSLGNTALACGVIFFLVRIHYSV